MGGWAKWHSQQIKYLIYNMLNTFCESPCEDAVQFNEQNLFCIIGYRIALKGHTFWP